MVSKSEAEKITSEEPKTSPGIFGRRSGTGTGSGEGEAEEKKSSGETSPDVLSRKKYYDALTTFVKVMMWVVPIAIGIALTLFGIKLNNVTTPVARIELKIDQLNDGNEELDDKIEKLSNDQSSIAETIEKIERGIDNLRDGNKVLKTKVEELRTDIGNSEKDEEKE